MTISDVISEDKYYVLNKDTAALNAGAIVRARVGSSRYVAITNLWNTSANPEGLDYYESARIVENSPDWYRRVYSVGGKFVNQDQAIATIAELVQDGPGE